MITKKEAWEIADQMRNSLKIQNEIEFSDFKTPPDIDFFQDTELFYDPNRNMIHLGVYGITRIFTPGTEAEFVTDVNFARGHESQHKKSTASKPYFWGVQRATEVVLEYISVQVEPSKRRFRNDNDYIDFANRILPSYGIYIGYQQVFDIMAGIANSIEDGRIERIRSNQFPGFEKMRLLARGKFWESQEQTYKQYDEIKDDPEYCFMVLVHQILSLSTCQVYSKGFIGAYAGTPLMDEIRSLMPYIAKGVMAGRTREMIMQVIELAKKLAPNIYEIAKLCDNNNNAVKQALADLIAEMIRRAVSQMSDTDLNEKDEDTDDGSGNSTFPYSDLVVTLDDETYDKLMEKSKPSDDGNGLMIRREHPKEEEQKSSCGKSEDQKKSSSIKDAQSEMLAPSTVADSKQMDAIKKAMKDAAEMTNEMAKKQIDSINRAGIHARKSAGPVVQNEDHPVTSESVKGICPRFQELRRAYKLKDRLPPVLAAQGRTLYRKNKRYFKSLSIPNVSYLDSGLVDPSRIYGLSFGDTEIFRKKGMDKKFDGCVYMLIDNSGSMAGNKRIEACKAAALIEESYRGLIPMKIVAFDCSSEVIHEVIKGWNEQQNLNCCWNFCLHGRSGYSNADGYDILIAQKELLARPESKKLLIVLSDGMPTDTTPAFVKNAVEETRKKGIQVSSIYFEEGSVVENASEFTWMYGEKDAIACPLSELSANLEQIAKRFSRS